MGVEEWKTAREEEEDKLETRLEKYISPTSPS
jgi:hypothetical protein